MAERADPTALGRRLDGARQADGTLTLDGASLPDGDLAVFVAELPDAHLRLRDAVVGEGSGPVTVTGTLADPWPIPALATALTDVRVGVAFPSATPGGRLTIGSATLTLPAGGAVTVAGSLSDEGMLALTLVPPTDADPPTSGLSALVAFATGGRADTTVLSTVSALAAVRLIALDVRFGVGEEAPAAVDLTLDVPGRWDVVPGTGFLSLDGLGATVRARHVPRPTGLAVRHAMTVRGTARIGTTATDVTVSARPGGRLGFGIAPQASTMPSLAEIVGEVADRATGEQLDAGLAALGVTGVGVDRITATVTTTPWALDGVRLGGHVTFAGGRLQIDVDLPGGVVHAALPPSVSVSGEPSGIDLAALARTTFGVDADLPALVVTGMNVRADPRAGTYELAAETREDWTWHVVDGGPALTLSSVGLALSRDAHGVGGELTAELAVGGVTFALGAGYDAGAAGWHLSGGARAADPLPLGTLVRDVGTAIGASVPEPLVSAVGQVAVDDLALEADTGTGAFAITVAIAATDAIAVGGTPHPWVIDLGPTTLTVRDVLLRLARTDGGTMTGAFRGTVVLGTASFSVDYAVPGPLVLKADVPEIRLTDLARHLASVADLGLPSGFPDVSLTGSKALFTAAGDGAYDVRVATTVAIGGVATIGLVATVLRAPRTGTAGAAVPAADGDGFAVALWTSAWPDDRDGWSPGSLWSPLSVLTVESAALFVCSTTPTPAQLSVLTPDTAAGATPVVSRQASRVRAGATFMALLRLDVGPLSVLGDVLGRDVRLDLFAALGRDGSTELRAHATTAVGRDAFAFSDFLLVWTSTASAEFDVVATASGTLSLDGSPPLTYQVRGELSSSGSGSLALAVQDWVHPFGYRKLTISALAIAITVGASGGGVGVELAGSFRFTTRTAAQFTFSVAGAIRNFSTPSALAMSLTSDSPGKRLRISEIVEGITSIDVAGPDSPVGPAVRVVDPVLEITELAFWAVTVDRIDIGGRTYTRGFGFHGDVTLFGVSVRLFAEVDEKAGRFSGSAEFPDVVQIGKVLTLARPSGPTTLSTATADARSTEAGKGPVLAVSSFLDERHTDYLFVAAEIRLFDVVQVDVYARANASGLVFSFDLVAGTRGTAAWATQHVDVVVSRERKAFTAGLSCDYGLSDVTLGGFDLFGVLPVPEIRLPDLRVTAVLDVAAAVDPPATFHLGATVTLTFMDLELHGSASLDLDLSVVFTELSALGSHLLDWIRDNLAAMLRAVLATAREFADWVHGRLEQFADAAARVGQALRDVYEHAADDAATVLREIGYAADRVAHVLDDVFRTGSAVALGILTGAGFPSADVEAAMRGVFDWTDPILDAAEQLFADFTSHVGDFFGSREVEMVLFNLTSHRLLVNGGDGGHVTTRDGVVVGPGGADVVATFATSTGRHGYVFVRDLDSGTDYQLFVQESSIVGNKYTGFTHLDPDRDEDNSGSRPLPSGACESHWDGGATAAYALHQLPEEILTEGRLLRDARSLRAIVTADDGDGRLFHQDPHGRLNARWHLEPVDDGYHHVVDLRYGRAIVAGDTYDGNLYHQDPRGRLNAQWRLDPADGGSFVIVDRLHGRAIVATDDGNLRHEDPAGGANARWEIAPRLDSLVLQPEVLPIGQDFPAPGGRATLAFESDGALVVRDETGRPRWTSPTSGTGRSCEFQDDGNLVVYDGDHRAAWASDTDGHPNAVLAVQDDGNVVIYDLDDDRIVLWASGTAH